MLDEIDKNDLNEFVNLFENKLTTLKDKAQLMLDKVQNFESHNDKLPEILEKFRGITRHFEDGHYKKMIVGELQKNHL